MFSRVMSPRFLDCFLSPQHFQIGPLGCSPPLESNRRNIPVLVSMRGLFLHYQEAFSLSASPIRGDRGDFFGVNQALRFILARFFSHPGMACPPE